MQKKIVVPLASLHNLQSQLPPDVVEALEKLRDCALGNQLEEKMQAVAQEMACEQRMAEQTAERTAKQVKSCAAGQAQEPKEKRDALHGQPDNDG